MLRLAILYIFAAIYGTNVVYKNLAHHPKLLAHYPKLKKQNTLISSLMHIHVSMEYL
jgi:hypothetical protein